MNVVDSSGWLEYFADGLNAKNFSEAIEDLDQLIVPIISVYEVFKKVIQQKDENSGLQAVALMKQGRVIELDESTALLAAKLSLQHKLPMADSLMLAAARSHQALLWTQDSDFKGLDGVKYFPRRKSK